MHSPAGGVYNSPADRKVASSQVKVEAQPDGVTSPSAEQKLDTATAAPADRQLVDGAALSSGPAGVQDNAPSVEVKLQADSTKSDARPEPGEISNVACVVGHKRDAWEVPNGSGLTVKLAVRVKGDEAVGSSLVAVLPELRLRDRCAFSHAAHKHRAAYVTK